MILPWLETLDGTPRHRAYAGDAGTDVAMPEAGTIPPRGFRNVPLGVRARLPCGWHALIQERSSSGKRGITTIGNVIDSGYDGELTATIANLSSDPLSWKKGERIIQVVFFQGLPTHPSLPQRGTKGLGSTGSN